MERTRAIRSRSSDAILLLCLVVGMACGDSGEPTRIELPTEASDESLIVAITKGDRPLELRAFDLIEGRLDDAWEISIDDMTVHALPYAVELDAMGLQPGQVMSAAENEPGRPIPHPPRLFSMEVNGDVMGAWRETSLDGALAEFRIPAVCTSFDARFHPLPSDAVPAFLVAAEGRLLMGDLSSRLYEIQSNGEVRRLSSEGLYYDAFATDDGEIHLAGAEGQVDRAVWAGPELLIVSDELLREDTQIVFIDGDPSSDERYAISIDGRLFVHNLSGWFEAWQDTDIQPQTLAWIGASQIRVTDHGGATGFGFDGGVFFEEVIHGNLAIGGAVTVLAYIPGYGAVAGTRFGQIYRRNVPSPWEFLDLLDVGAVETRGFVPYEDGFLYARADGIFQAIGELGCNNPTLITGAKDPNRRELGVVLSQGPVVYGGRAELTRMGRDVVAIGWQGPEAARVPVLVWFEAD